MSTLISFTAPDAPKCATYSFCLPSVSVQPIPTIYLVLVVYFTVITNNLQSSDHLAHCEESEYLCEDDSV